MIIIGASSCQNSTLEQKVEPNTANANLALIDSSYYFNYYSEVELKTDINYLSRNQKDVLQLLFQAAQIMDDIFWKEAYGNKNDFLSKIKDEKLRKFASINYGPWDRLNGNIAYLTGFGQRPKGANFYPFDMTTSEFDALIDSNKTSQYTVIRRDKSGILKVIWYHYEFNEEIENAAELLKKAAEKTNNEGLRKYLNLRAEALLTDSYQASDIAWMDMKNSDIDFIIGPIENYEDQLYGYKASHEAYLLLKDKIWSEKLAKFAKFLPKLQRELPVDEIYKKETPGQDVDLNAYDVVFYAGDCNAASKTIAINLPNDPIVQLNKGSRKLQLKNAMKAKFDQILLPISNALIATNQKKYVSFDAFFANTMFHEVAHGMGIKNVVGKPDLSCRVALKEQFSALEECKADILGLYLVTKLNKMGELKGDLMENYVTFMAGIIRSIRFGISSSHGKANMISFNYFLEHHAFTRNKNGTYSIDIDKMEIASAELTKVIIKLQGDGDYEHAKAFVERYAQISNKLKKDLAKLDKLTIPKDIYFKQGADIIGL